MGWNGMRRSWDEMGWDGMRSWDEMGWDVMGWGEAGMG